MQDPQYTQANLQPIFRPRLWWKTPGIVVVDKPSGLSSAQVVKRVKYALAAEKAGHSGTLDPAATGLLVVLLNSATRYARFAEGGQKEYQAEVVLGVRTSSDDITGELLYQTEVTVSDEQISAAVSNLLGTIVQVPPKISAISVNGKRAYQLARRGIDVELSPRQVEVTQFLWTRVTRDRLLIRVVCSKGTYIRSLARDLGEMLGCGACLGSLRRTASRPFGIEESVALETVSHNDVQSWEKLFIAAPRIQLSEGEELMMARGDIRLAQRRSTDLSEFRQNSVIVAQNGKGSGVGIFERSGETWRIGLYSPPQSTTACEGAIPALTSVSPYVEASRTEEVCLA